MRKRAAAFIAVLLTAVALLAVTADATIPPTGVTASVSPSHVLAAPYTFTVSGSVTFRKCPAGSTDTSYCVNVPPGQFCKGTMTVSVKLDSDPLLADSNEVVQTVTGPLNGSCAYSITTTIPKADLTATSHFTNSTPGAFDNVTFSVKFGGNAILSPASASPQTVMARLTEP